VSLGSHIPVLLNAAVDGLMVRADGIYVDCTYGRGGHSREILRRLGPRGRLLALDRDPQAVATQEPMASLLGTYMWSFKSKKMSISYETLTMS
jgi:16S rRNA C1402 N4-methylase RsmH